MVALLVREIIFRLPQCMWSKSTNLTDRETDRQTTYHSNTALTLILKSFAAIVPRTSSA